MKVSIIDYSKEFYNKNNVILTQGSFILTKEIKFIQFAPKIKIPNTQIELESIGIIIIENACDLIEYSDNEEGEKYRKRKTESVEVLFLYDAQDFLKISFKISNENKIDKKFLPKLITFIENSNIDLMFFYLPYHFSFLNEHLYGLIAYCKKSRIIDIHDFSPDSTYPCILPPHREKLRNMHLKYDLRVPTTDLSEMAVLKWLENTLNHFKKTE
jgi:hypothetical protein